MVEYISIFVLDAVGYIKLIYLKGCLVVDDKLTLQKREHVFCGKIINLYKDTLTDDNGNIVMRERTVYPEVAAVVPVCDNGNILLVSQFRYGPFKLLWEIPAGIAEENETTQDCVGRELEEETGYRAKSIESIGSFYPSPGISTEHVYLYKACGLEPGTKSLDEGEDIREVVEFSVADIKRMIDSGEIVDGKTLIALYKIFDS